MSDELEHFGVKGMRWGVRKDEPSSGMNPKVKKGLIAAGAILAVSGGIAASVAISRSGNQKLAQRAIQESLNVPFQWKDGAGQWHRFTDAGAEFVPVVLNRR